MKSSFSNQGRMAQNLYGMGLLLWTFCSVSQFQQTNLPPFSWRQPHERLHNNINRFLYLTTNLGGPNFAPVLNEDCGVCPFPNLVTAKWFWFDPYRNIVHFMSWNYSNGVVIHLMQIPVLWYHGEWLMNQGDLGFQISGWFLNGIGAGGYT